MEKLLGQKRLERIILINSSTFRYAEVYVDGNTHISGDNSSGKSTFLQIETLFYTGDSSAKALGIGDGKLPFAQYNLKMNNSYIVYEVRRSNDPGDRFLVFLKNSNWPSFQFFDCPYSKDIFIDENGTAYDNLENVKNAALRLHPGLDMRQARGRKEYIDVLYGWRDGTAGKIRSWEKFSLTTCRGIDRPHEKITNLLKMLLNLGKVQGDVLKEMIVSSMGSTAKPFDVRVEQERASQLMREYSCIRSWTSDPNMLAKQKQYQKTYEAYLKERIEFEQYPGKAKYARNYYAEQITEISKERDAAQADLDAFVKAMTGRRETARQIIDALKDRRSRLQGDFDKIAPKRESYSGLMPLLPLMESAVQKRESLALARERLEDLTGQSASLKEKFDAQKEDLNAKFRIRKAEVETAVAQKEAEATGRKNAISESVEEERDAEEKRHTDMIRLLNEKKDRLAKLVSDGKIEKQRILNSHPKGEDLKKLSEREGVLSREIRQLEKDIAELEHSISASENEKKNAPAAVRLGFSDSIHDKEDALKAARRNRDELVGKLGAFDGSLAEWLSRNVEGWNRTLGKVLSEKVLFNQGLSPEKTSSNPDSVYGVRLDLSGLSPTETDPALLKERLDNAIIDCEKAEKALQEEKDRAEAMVRQKVEEIEKRIAEATEQHGKLSDKKTSQDGVLDTVKAQIASLMDEERRIVKEEADKKQAEIDVNLKELEQVKGEIRKENDGYDTFCKGLRNRKETLQKEIQKDFEDYEKGLRDALIKDKEQLDAELRQIDADLAQALSEKGVDADRVKAIQDEIDKLDKQVKDIEANEPLYHGYLKDKADYFDHESEWAASLASLTDSIRKNEDDEKRKVEEEDRVAKTKEDLVKEREGEIVESKTQVAAVDQYYAENRQEDFANAMPIETDETAEAIVEKDKGAEGRIDNQLNVLKLCWSTFRNILLDFGIKRFFPAAADCQDIGTDPRAQQDVYEFITEDLISTHCKAWNTAAVPFVSGIAYQATDYATDIKKVRETVSGINRLFREYNFTDVIKRIELSVEDVGSDLIALIKRSVEIHEDYCGENDSDRNFLDGSSFNKDFIAFIQDIASNLATCSESQVDLEDMFTLYIEVDEGLNRSGRRRDIKDMGSSGIDTIFKDLLYLLLLTNIRKRCSQDGQGFMVHCPIDEQATLSPSNFNSLMNLANRMGVYILANSPVLPNGTEESFRYAYTFWKRQGSEFTNATNILSFTQMDTADERETES